MKKHTEITHGRVANFLKKLKRSYYTHATPLGVSYFASDEPLTFSEIKHEAFIPIAIGDKWGEGFSCAWFKLSGMMPPAFAGHEVVALIDLGGEACLYNSSGDPVQGITNKRIGQEFDEAEIKRRVYLTDSAIGNEAVELLLDAGANNIMGVTELFNAMIIADGTLNQAEIAVFRRDVWQLFLDYEFLYNLYFTLDPTSRRARLILFALNEVINHYQDDAGADVVTACRQILANELQKRANASAINVSAIGHAHIDIAWLWPVRETTRKVARSFSTALKMMDEYGDYKFGASQPYLYEVAKQHFPGLWNRIKEAVRAGRWELQGGMYVEADCNVTGGESLVRQLLYGKRFFSKEFDVEVTNLWLPDVFGYSAALPQMLKKSGIEYFMTQKISWNQFNKFPHHTFFWRGIDGTEVLSHFLSNNTYNSPCYPENIRMFEFDNRDADRTEHALLLYGVGDGGGGPARKHIERLLRARDTEDMPKVEMEFASDFFPKLEATSRDLQYWDGELYLEYHRGTLTSQALVKKRNRKLELKLREAEGLYALYSREQYPTAEFESIWKSLLLNQFHDIIPGSSIRRVYAECHQLYDEIESRLDALLAPFGLLAPAGNYSENADKHVVFHNSLSWSRDAIIEVPEQVLPGVFENEIATATLQKVERDGVSFRLVEAELPSFGFATCQPIYRNSATGAFATQHGLNHVLENGLLRVVIGKNGFIESIWDIAEDREVLSGHGNVLQLYEDLPITYEAWDIDIYYEEKPPKEAALSSINIVETGPIRAALRVRFAGAGYDITQTIRLIRGSRRIDFDTEIDWQVSQTMLRAEFPVNVFASKAAFDIQYGHVFRNTHENTSWDLAQFEVVAHKWADLSQPNYGVAIINDCKYGHKIKGDIISLNLLRSPTSPDETADKHVHRFQYALFPHTGNHLSGNVIREAYEFNIPPLVTLSADKPEKPFVSMLQVSGNNIVVEAIKKAEDSDSIIVRMYESHGVDSKNDVVFGFPVSTVRYCSLMEKEMDEINLIDHCRVSLPFGPFEIHTLKISI